MGQSPACPASSRKQETGCASFNLDLTDNSPWLRDAPVVRFDIPDALPIPAAWHGPAWSCLPQGYWQNRNDAKIYENSRQYFYFHFAMQYFFIPGFS
ncbi:hypothetical protein [Komagataeibacter sp. FXV3]|uniref:hypothetical protein n=1 Tax=Komagataeibacter sp. FXV3 TaxID=2608998 RepID=UPI00187B43F0|nr:hypothetical protein [Komagataeibacter sp. FXV3]MBE7729334.1 hypothetical protein [Komagataeibacter sp. FXV3]